MTLSDLQGYAPIAGLLKCDFCTIVQQCDKLHRSNWWNFMTSTLSHKISPWSVQGWGTESQKLHFKKFGNIPNFELILARFLRNFQDLKWDISWRLIHALNLVGFAQQTQKLWRLTCRLHFPKNFKGPWRRNCWMDPTELGRYKNVAVLLCQHGVARTAHAAGMWKKLPVFFSSTRIQLLMLCAAICATTKCEFRNAVKFGDSCRIAAI